MRGPGSRIPAPEDVTDTDEDKPVDDERRKMGDELRRRENDFRAIVHNNAEAMIVLDDGGVIRYLNPAALKLFNLPESELTDKVLGFPIILNEPVSMYVIRGLKEFVAVEMRMVNVEWVGKPSYLVSLRDVTGHIRYEEELRRARDEIVGQVRARTSDLWITNRQLQKEIEVRKRIDEELRSEIEERRAVESELLDEIGERENVENALRKSEEKYRELVENANSIIIRWDMEGNLTFFNEFAERFFGYPESEIIGKNVVGNIVPATDTSGRDLAAMMEDIKRHPEQYMTNVNENVRSNGERVWISWTNRAILDEQENVVEILSVGNDITAQIRAEEALRKSEANLVRAQKIARLGNWEWDLSSNEVNGSDETFRMFDIDPKVTRSAEAFLSRFPAGERERVERALNAALYEGKSYNIDHKVVLPYGIERIMHSEGEVTRDSSGRPLNIFGVVHDITERVLAEKALQESEEKYRGIVETANDGIWVIDNNARTVFVNQTLVEMLGHDPGVMLGRSIFEFIYEEELGVAANIWDQVRSEGKMRLDFRFRRKDGRPLWALFSVSPLHDRDRHLIGYLCMLMDITERKKAEEELIRSDADLKWAQRIGHIGSWEWDIKKDEERWSDEAYNIMGLEPGSAKPDFSTLVDFVHPDDRIVVKRAMRDALCKRNPYNVEYRIVRKDGKERCVHSDGEVIFNDQGDPVYMAGSIHDITDLKHIEKALRASEEKFRSLTEATSAAICIVQDGRFKYFNPAMEKVIGYTKEELGALDFMGLIHPDQRDIVNELYMALIRGRSTLERYELHIITRDGEQRWFDASGSTITFEGRPAVLVTAFDTTERKKLEDRLSVSDKRFNVLVNSNTIGITIASLDGIIEANEIFLRTIGYTREDLLQGVIDWRKLTPPEYEHPDNRGLVELVAQGSCVPYEKEYYRKDGSRVPILFGAALLEKEPLTWVGFALEITERKQMEQALHESEERLSLAQRTGHVGVFDWDMTTGRVVWTSELEEIFGVPRGRFENVYEGWARRVLPEDLPKIELFFREWAESGDEDRQWEYRFIKDGEVRWMAARGRIIYGPDGRPLRMIGTNLDITDRKRTEEALKDSKAQAELYLEIMAHDINNFNQVGISNLELALEHVEDIDDKGLLVKALSSLESSSKLIENVRVLQKIRSEEPNIKPVDLSHALKEAKDDCLRLSEKNVSIEVNGQGGYVVANEFLKEIFSNIIENAIKHTPGDVSISVSLKRVYGAEGNYHMVEFEDNGPGIPDEVKEGLFSRFERGQTKAKGSGLGLYIVRLLVEDYRGRVWVEDRVSGDYTKGSRFVIMLPAAEQ